MFLENAKNTVADHFHTLSLHTEMNQQIKFIKMNFMVTVTVRENVNIF